MDNELLKVLAARDKRWEMRKKLVEKRQSCLITITMCVPVAFRTDEEFWELFQHLCSKFWEILIFRGYSANFEGYIRGYDGPAYFVSTKSEAKEIKKICVESEETIPGGRMLDIDVMDSDGTPIGRSDIGLPPRKCFICENTAAICVSRKLHSREEIAEYVEQLKEQVISNYGFKA